MLDGSKMLTDANVDVRQHGKHLWTELIQHAKTEQMLKQYIKDPELRNIQKILDGLRQGMLYFLVYDFPVFLVQEQILVIYICNTLY